MRLWDSIRRLTGNTFSKHNSNLSSLGFLKNKKAQKRQLQIEQFEDRVLLSINSPELNAIFINQDESQFFDPSLTNKVYHIAPDSLLLRFNEGQNLDPATLATGIQIVRAGSDGKFDTADDVIVGIGWIGLNGSRGDGKDIVTTNGVKSLNEGIVGNEVIIRFTEALPDDLYQLRLIGSGATPLKNLTGDVFHDTKNQTVSFELDLGAQIVSVVPQPVTRATDGTLTQARDKVELYFNANDPLYFPGFNISAANAMSKSYTTTDSSYLKLFQLIATRNTADSSDDKVYSPSSIEYTPATGKMVLTFAKELDKLDGFSDGVSAARLRVGTLYETTNTTILDLNDGDKPGDSFHTSFDLKSHFNTTSTVTGPQSLVIHGQIDPKFDPMEYTGARDEPGHRDLPIGYILGGENHINGDTLSGSQDITDGPTIRYYNFKTILGYDGAGNPYNNQITEAQKNLARQIYQMYSRYLGIEFIEDTDLVNPRGTTVATGDLRVVGMRYTSAPGGVAGLGSATLAIMDKAEDWGADVYGGSWFQTAMHEIGHSIGLGHTYDLPNGTRMGSTSLIDGQVKEATYPGDYDILHGQYIYRPDSTDVDLYKFVVEPGQRGKFSAEIFAQRENAASLLDATLTLYRQVKATDGSIFYEMVARNDDYFGKDSFLEMYLSEGTYFIGVASTGNDKYNPELEGTGEGGTTSGNYELRLTFTPGGVNPDDTTTYKEQSSKTHLVDATGVKFDGDHDGTPGGEYNFWFNVQNKEKTIYVDKIAPAGGNGSILKPYNTIKDALSNVTEGDIIRIVGNNFENDATNLLDNVAYEIGTNSDTKKVLSDGATFDVPRGVTVLIDAGAVLKFAGTNINVGSFAQNVDRSGGSIQVLGTPANSVIFTSYYDQTIGTKTNPLNTVAGGGDWGGISIRNDLDYEFIASYDPASGKKQREVLEAQGVFLNYINHADMRYGGGEATGVQGYYTPVNLNASQATVSYNTITNSRNAAISADLSSFEETRFQSWDHNANTIYTLDYTRIGPDIHGNRVTNNAVNGLAIRAKTVTNGDNSSAQKVTGHIRFDDTDIVHFMNENIVIRGTTGEYATTPVTAPALSVEYQQFNDADYSLGAYRHTSLGNALNDLKFDSNLLLSAVPADGEYFSLSDGTTTLVFEFNHIDKANHGGVKQGRVQVDINSTDNVATVMQKLITVINSFSTADYLANYKKYIPSGGSQMVKSFKINAKLNTAIANTIALNSTGTELEINGTGLVKAASAGRLLVDPGIIIKALNTRIEAEMGAQFLAEGTAAHQVIFTSVNDTRYGAGGSYSTWNRNEATYLPKEGDWSGIFFGPDSSGSLDHVVIAFGGGSSAAESSNTGFNAVEIHQADVRIVNSRFEHNTGVTRGDSSASSGQVGRGSATPAVIFIRGSQPVIVNNEFFNNTNGLSNAASALAIISVNANALTDESVIDWGRSTGRVSNYSEFNDNYGPLVRDNRFTGNSVNGMVVRGEIMTVAGIWDDADIAHVLYNEIKIPNYHSSGGLRLMSAPGQSLVIKLLGTNAGFTTLGTPFEYSDRIGGSLQIIGVPKYPVVLTSLKDDTVGAGRNLKGQVMFDTNNDGKASSAAPGDWRSVKLDSYSNDRNVMVVTELEKSANESEDRNGTTAKSQYLGWLATEDKAGDDIYHLGYELLGAIRSDKANEADVYHFKATPGTEVWIDIDDTTRDLDLVIEIIDANGNILARSDNAFMEEYGYGSFVNEHGYAEVETYEGTQAFTMNKDRWNRMDYYSINQRDPGMRIVIPGPGEDYYVRVRSVLGIADVKKVTQAASNGKTFVISDDNYTHSFVFDFNRDANDTDYLAGNKINGNFIVPMKGVANTEEAKQQAIVDAINKTNEIFLAKNKNDKYGQGIATARIAYIVDGDYNVLSYIAIDGVELNFIAKDTGMTCLANTSGSYTLKLRLQESEEIPGCSVTYADIRYATTGIEAYGFPQNSPIQAEFKDVAGTSFANAGELGNLLGSNSGTISVSGYLTNLSQVDWYKFSLDYRGIQYIAGSSNAGNIWSAIFDIDYADGLTRPDLTLWVFDSGGHLIYIGGDSNVADDQYDPTLTTSIEKLSAGSAGAYDPFIGPANLVAGVDGGGDSKTYYVAVTSATTFADVMKSAQTRLEPIDSIQRVVEERVDQGQDMDNAWGDTTSEVEAAKRLTLTPDEYKLGDVVTYVGTSGGIYMIDPFTGDSVLYRSYDGTLPNSNEIDLRDNGKLYTISRTGNYVPDFVEINQGQVTSKVSSISTQISGKWYHLNNTTVVWHDSSYTVQAMTTSNYGTAYYSVPNFTGTGYGEGFTLSIGTVNGFSQSLYDNQTGAIGDKNVMFLHAANGVGITTDRTTGDRVYATSGTNQACSSSLVMTQFTENNGLRSNNETITAMAQGNDGSFYVVTDAGNLYRIQNPLSQGWSLSINYHTVGTSVIEVPAMRYNGGGPRLVYLGTCKNDEGVALNLTGIDAGPRNVEDGTYSNKLFLTSTDNKLRAIVPSEINSVGSIVYSPVFVGGKTSVTIPAGANSITFTSFDYNLWHRTSMENDPVQPSPSLVRTTGLAVNGGNEYPHNKPEQGASWYFGMEDPRNTDTIWRDAQPGSITYDNRYLTGNEASYNTYNVPGGSYGSLTSNSFTLQGYSPEDKPSLYFTYKTDSDSSGSLTDSHDLPAVYVSVDGGQWVALAVGNAYAYNDTKDYLNQYWNRTNEAQYNYRNWTYRDNSHYIDILENDNLWRQAKVDLSQFAGSNDIRLKFVFSSAEGDIGLGTGTGKVAGTLITAPTADLLLDGRSGQTVLPGDKSLNYSNSYYRIGSKTFQFVNGYSLYVPVTPGAYGNTLTLTINGQAVNIPLDPAASAEQIMTTIMNTINAAGIQDSHGQFVTVKRYLDINGKATGQLLSFENAESMATNIGNYLVMGGPQDRTLENIFAMTTAELSNFLSQSTIPVPFRSDMTQSQIAGSITFMTNLAFNDLLKTELNQTDNSGQAIPLVEALLQNIENMGPTDNIVTLINSALTAIRATGSTKAESFLTALVTKLNVAGKSSAITGINSEIAKLNAEVATLANAALTNLRSGYQLNDAQNTAFNTARTGLNNGENPVTVLQTLLAAITGNGETEVALQNGIRAIQTMVANYNSLHRQTQLGNFVASLAGVIPTNIFQQLDNLSITLLNTNPLTYSRIIYGELESLRITLNQAAASQEVLNLVTTARDEVTNNPEGMFIILRNLLTDLAAAAVPSQLATNGVQTILNSVNLFYTSVASVTSNSLTTLRNSLVLSGADQDVLTLLNAYRLSIVATPENTFIFLDALLADLNNLGTTLDGRQTAINGVSEMRIRAADFFSGKHVSDDLDDLSVQLKADARTTAIADVNSLLVELRAHVSENAVDTINRVLNISLASTDPRKLIDIFSQSGGLLEKNLRIDTSSVHGATTLPNSFTRGQGTTNSVQMTLVNSLSVAVRGPLGVQNGGLDGARSNGLTRGGSLDPIYRSLDNQNGGFYIDNIIVGFASRGEMVTNSPSNTDFNFTTGEEAYVRSGSYQLEIRRGTEYSTYSSQYLGLPDATIWNLFNINERHSEGISFFSPSSAQVSHNQKFSISDGVNTLTFVFINTKFGGGSGDDIKIEFTDGDSNIAIANKIKSAINTAFQKGLFKVTASTGSQQANTSKTHYLVDLFNATDFLNLTEDATPIKHVFYGASQGKMNNDGTVTGDNGNEEIYASYTDYGTTKLDGFLASDTATRMYIDRGYYDWYYQFHELLTRTGDSNTMREKGQLTLFGNSVTYSSDYAIKLAPGDNPVAVARQQADYRSTSPLIPGIAISNNVLAFNNAGGINIEGLADAIPFVRILNNTIYGSSTAVGAGISLGSNSAATIMNNIFANLNTGVLLNGANSNEIVYRANTYKGNTDNGEGTSSSNLTQILADNAPLFVNESRGNFYPAPSALVIDSATQKLEERRQWYIAAMLQLGIPESALIAPDTDMYGQMRSYDENTSGAGTGGDNPGYDRGAIERVDFSKPTSALGIPHDVTAASQVGATGDQDPNRNDVFIIGEYFNKFTIQLSDTGIGIDALSVADNNGFVHEHIITVIEQTWDGKAWVDKTLVLGSDYFADYNSANDLITLTPNRGQWSSDARYVITLNNGETANGICDLAGNFLMANRDDGTTVFNIVFTGYDHGDAPDPKYPTLLPSDGPRHVVYYGYQLGDSISTQDSPNASTLADGDIHDDGVYLPKEELIAGGSNTIKVKITDINSAIIAKRGESNTVGWLNVWIDWDDSGDFSNAVINDYREHFQFEITKDMLANADEDGYIQLTIAGPSKKADGKDIEEGFVYARFRFSSQKDLDPTGFAPDGEVEDYRFWMSINTIDNPTIMFLGAPDVENPGLKGYSDQAAGYVSMDKVILAAGEANKMQVTVTNNSTKQAYLYAWIDVNGVWTPVKIGTNGGAYAVGKGTSAITVTLPDGVAAGQYKIRFRLSSLTNLTVSGSSPDGEVEDYTVSVTDKRRDYGNAPGNENTLRENGGASHVIVRDANGVPQLALGQKAFEELDGRAATSMQDFKDNMPADNDGLVKYQLIIGKKSYIELKVTNTTTEDAFLNIWVDLNGNGKFDDAGEQLVKDYLVAKGTKAGTVIRIELDKVPTELTIGGDKEAVTVGERYMRMRLSHQAGIGPRGGQVTVGGKLVDIDGEVEDYVIKLVDKGSTISGNVYNDLDGDGKYGTVTVEVPKVNVVFNKGATVPFVSGSELDYQSSMSQSGLSEWVYLGFNVQIGGKTYDSFVVTDKGAVMMANSSDYSGYYQYINGQLVYVSTGTGSGTPSLYSGKAPTFAPFLTNMLTDAEVTYERGTDADGYRYVRITWNGDFGVCITDYPAFVPAKEGEKAPDDFLEGDIVTYFYSDAFIARLEAMPDADFSPVQIGTNYGGTSPYMYNATQTYYFKQSLVYYLSSLNHSSIRNPNYVAPAEGEEPVEPEYLPSAYRYVTYRLNPAQGINVTQPTVTTVMPDPVILPEAPYRFSVSINRSSGSSLRETGIQSFGFWFEFGGQRYNSFKAYDNGIIGLINANGGVDAWIELGIPYVSTTPTIDMVEGVSVRGNKFVQIRWNSAYGVIIEDDPAGDIISLFYTNDAYPNNGLNLGGPSAEYNVYTDLGPVTVGFRYADGSYVNILPDIIGETTINSRNEFEKFVKAINGQRNFRVNAVNGELYHYEPGLTNVKVILEFDDGKTMEVMTDSTGHYEFIDVFAGTYKIRLDNSTTTDWAQTMPADGYYTIIVNEDITNFTDNDFGYYRKGNVTITDTTVVEGTGGRKYAEIEVELRDAYGTPITITYETRDGTATSQGSNRDYTGVTNGSVTVYPQLAPVGEWTVKAAVADMASGQYDRSISGSFIAYEVYEGGRWKVYVYDTRKDAGTAFCLTDKIGHTNNDRMPSILQTGNTLRIVWSSYDPVLKSNQIFYSQADIDNLEQLTDFAFSEDKTKPDPIRAVSGISTATATGDNLSPQISSYVNGSKTDFVVTWMCTMKDGSKEIFCIDSLDAIEQILPGNIQRVTNSGATKSKVTVDGRNIVWVEENSVNGTRDIMWYNTGTKNAPVNITSAIVGTSSSPTISGNHIAWQQTVDSGTKTQRSKVMYYNIESGEISDIDYGYGVTNVYRYGQAPCIDGDWLVWQESGTAAGKFDVMAYNITSKILRNLSVHNTNDDIAPQIVGTQVVWRAYIAEGYGEKAEWQVRFVDLAVDGFIPVTISESQTTDWEPMLTDRMIVWRTTNDITKKNSIMVATHETAVAKATIQVEITTDGIYEGNKQFSVVLTDVKGGLADISKGEAVVTIIDDDGIGNGLDFGDAPATYDTLLKDDGARHVIKYATNSKNELVPIALYKPTTDSRITPVDAEADGHPSVNADGDNNNTSNDENGVVFVGDWTAGTRVCVTVYATTDSVLNLWIDWNGNGRFGNKATGMADTGEHVMLYGSKDATQGDQKFALKEGANEIWLDIPADAVAGKTYARFRVTAEEDSDISWFGIAGSGEVEDYAVSIVKDGKVDPTKLVYVDGDTLVIRGTAKSDTISIVRSANSIVVTHSELAKSETFSTSGIRRVDVDGLAGNDAITITGLASEEHYVMMNPFSANITSDTLTINVSNVSNITYVGTSGKDKVEMRDSTGDDTVVVSPNAGSMTGPNSSFVNSVRGVNMITTYSIRGGHDSITFNGSAKADQVTSWMNTVNMCDVVAATGSSEVKHAYYNRAIGFTQVIANAGSNNAGNVATVIERIDAAVHAEAGPEKTVVTREQPRQGIAGQSLNLTLDRFNSVAIASQTGSNHTAVLTGSSGNDTLVATDTQVNLSGKRSDGANYVIQVNNFGHYAVNGGAGNDTVTYASSKGGEHLAALSDGKTLELFGKGNMDTALLELIAFESARFDAANFKCTKDVRNVNKALIEIDLIGDWVDKNG